MFPDTKEEYMNLISASHQEIFSLHLIRTHFKACLSYMDGDKSTEILEKVGDLSKIYIDNNYEKIDKELILQRIEIIEEKIEDIVNQISIASGGPFVTSEYIIQRMEKIKAEEYENAGNSMSPESYLGEDEDEDDGPPVLSLAVILSILTLIVLFYYRINFGG